MRLKQFLPALAVFALATTTLQAAMPSTLNYQGRLRQNIAGFPTVPDSTGNTVTFKIWDSLSGGATLWSETWPGATNGVSTLSGLFNVILGSITPITLPFDQPYFLEVTWTNPGGTAEIMLPRQPLTAAPYAFRAREVDGPLSITTSGGSAIFSNAGNAGIGVLGTGLTGTAGSAGAPGGIGVLAGDGGQGAGALALKVSGGALFSAGDVTFTPGSTVYFNGVNTPGLSASISAPLSLTLSAALASALYVTNGAGTAVIAQGVTGLVAVGHAMGLSVVADASGGTAVSALSNSGIAIYASNNSFGGFQTTISADSSHTNHAVEGRNTTYASKGILGGDPQDGLAGVYGIGQAKGVWGESFAGPGVYGDGLIGVEGAVTVTGATAIKADVQGNAGSLAIHSLGDAIFDLSGAGPNSVTFNTAVFFNGPVIGGATVAAPLSLTLNSSVAAPLAVNNAGGGTAVSATAKGGAGALETGLWGYGSSSSVANGSAYGVYGVSDDPSSTFTGTLYGVYGTASGSGGSAVQYGVYGSAVNITGLGAGVYGTSGAGTGVEGISGNGNAVAGYILSASNGASAIFGQAAGPNGSNAIRADQQSTNVNSIGVYSNATVGVAIEAQGPVALSITGNAQFNGAANAVTFNTAVFFNGPTSGISLSPPVSLNLNSAGGVPLSVSNASGTALGISSGGTGLSIVGNSAAAIGENVVVNSSGSALQATNNGSGIAVNAIGNSSSGAAVSAQNINGGLALYAEMSGSGQAMQVINNGTGIGIFGALSNSASAIEGFNSGSGNGLYGVSALGYGILGTSNSATNPGIVGNANAGPGVEGNSSTGTGVLGSVNDTAVGVAGSNGGSGIGVQGTSANGIGGSFQGSTVGVSTTASGANSVALSAYAPATGGSAIKAQGTLIGVSAAASTVGTGVAVFGQSNNTSPLQGAVVGFNSASPGNGIYGSGDIGVYGDGNVTGVYGSSNGSGGAGVWGTSIDENSYGMLAVNTDSTGPFGPGTDVALSATASNTTGVAGYFQGFNGVISVGNEVGVSASATSAGATNPVGVYGGISLRGLPAGGAAGVKARNTSTSTSGSPAIALDVDGGISYNNLRADKVAGTTGAIVTGTLVNNLLCTTSSIVILTPILSATPTSYLFGVQVQNGGFVVWQNSGTQANFNYLILNPHN